MMRKMNDSGTVGTSLPGTQGPKGETSRQTFYGSKKVTESSIGRLEISGSGKFAYVPENVTPKKEDYILYTEESVNSYTLYSITSSIPDTITGNFTCQCIQIDQFSKDTDQSSEIEDIDVNIVINPVNISATIRKFGITSGKWISGGGKNLLYPIETSNESVNLDTKIFNICFYSNKNLSNDIKFVLEFTDVYSSPRTYSSLLYRFGAYGQTKENPNVTEAMSDPILTYRGVLDAYRNQTMTSSHLNANWSNMVMNYTDPASGYVPDNYCIERLDNFSITIKDFDEIIEKETLFNKDVFIPVELLSSRGVCGNRQKDRSNYKIILTAYVKKTPDICEKIFVSDFTSELKKMMGIN